MVGVDHAKVVVAVGVERTTDVGGGGWPLSRWRYLMLLVVVIGWNGGVVVWWWWRGW